MQADRVFFDKRHWVGLRRPDFRRRFWRERKEFLTGFFSDIDSKISRMDEFRARLDICWDEWDSMVGMVRKSFDPLLSKRAVPLGQGRVAVFTRLQKLDG